MKELYKELRVVRELKQQSHQGPVTSTPPVQGLLGSVCWEAIPNQTLMPNYIFTDWASARLDLSSENLDHWLIFYVSFLLQIMSSSYHIWCVRNSAKTWHLITTIWLTFMSAASLIIVTWVPKIFAILRPRYRMLLMFLPLHTLPIHVSCLVHSGSSPALINSCHPSQCLQLLWIFFCYLWDIPFYILSGYYICKGNW